MQFIVLEGLIAFSDSGTSSLIGGGWACRFLIHSWYCWFYLCEKKCKNCGLLMLIAAIRGFISIFMAYILPGILLGIAGIMGIFKKDKMITEHRV